MLGLKRNAFLGLMLAGTLLAGGSGASAQNAIKVVVNGNPITSNEIRERAAFLRLVHKGMGQAELMQAATDESIDEILKLGEADTRRVKVSDQEVNAAFASMAQNMKASPDQLMAGLRQQGVNPQTLKDRIKAQIAWQRLVMARFQKTISIADSQVAAALEKQATTGKGGPDKNAIAQGTTTEYALQQIIMVVPATPPGLAAQRLKEGEGLKAKINGCEGLVDIVRGYKETIVKSIGKRTADELPDQFKGILAETPVGKASKPVNTGRAVELLVVCEKREIQGDFSVKAKVEGDLRKEEGELLSRRYLTELKRAAIISYK